MLFYVNQLLRRKASGATTILHWVVDNCLEIVSARASPDNYIVGWDMKCISLWNYTKVVINIFKKIYMIIRYTASSWQILPPLSIKRR